MRDYLHIQLADQKVERQTFTGEQIARSGRFFIARELVACGAAKVEPLSEDNPLIFEIVRAAPGGRE